MEIKTSEYVETLIKENLTCFFGRGIRSKCFDTEFENLLRLNLIYLCFDGLTCLNFGLLVY
jgi:hypothetical protein